MTPYESAILAIHRKYIPPMYQRLLIAITEQPLTIREIRETIDAHYVSVYKALMILRDHKAIHIAGWQYAEHGPHLPRWSAGPGKNATRPAKLTPAERSARYRRKHAIFNSPVTFSTLLRK